MFEPFTPTLLVKFFCLNRFKVKGLIQNPNLLLQYQDVNDAIVQGLGQRLPVIGWYFAGVVHIS